MTSLRFGIKLSQDATIDQLRDLWRLADEGGFDSCWVMDHFATLGPRDDGPIFETWTMLAAMAQLTTRTRDRVRRRRQHLPPPGGAGEDGGHGRPPVRRAPRLRHRRRLGRERAHHARAGVRHRRDRADRLEESLQVIRGLWTQPRTTFAGEHYQLQDAVAEPKPVQRPHPPIWIGGSGPKRTLRLAAQYADVWNAAGGTAEEVAASSRILDQHCADVGRDPSEIRRSVQLGVGADDVDQVASDDRAPTSPSASPTSCSSCGARTRWPSASSSPPGLPGLRELG